MSRNFLIVDPEEGIEVLKAFSSPARVKVLKLLHTKGAMNINDIARTLNLPQSSVSSNVQILEDAGLIRTETQRARKGNQKLCHTLFDEVLVMFKEDTAPVNSDTVEVAMPLETSFAPLANATLNVRSMRTMAMVALSMYGADMSKATPNYILILTSALLCSTMRTGGNLAHSRWTATWGSCGDQR